MNPATPQDEIKPLRDLCKKGKLFEVQEWISEGRPVNPSILPEKCVRKKSPLEIAIDKGFHSLVKVLLDGGAMMEEGTYSALEHALLKRRLDMVELLVDHGADIHSVDMTQVFDTWDPEIMEYFIERGADVETGHPFASAFMGRIYAALGVFMRYKDRFPSFHEQSNIALRHHCSEGNPKWVSLMLWAGADPHAKGCDYPIIEDPDPEDELSAVEIAALHGHFDLFKLKKMRPDPDHPGFKEILRWSCYSEKADFLKELLEMGFQPNDQKNGGSSLILSVLEEMSRFSFDLFWQRQNKNIDTRESREKMKMIHLLVKKGARWIPRHQNEIGFARRSLLKMVPDYTVEFIWIMSKYNACKKEDVEELVRTPAIRALTSKNQTRIDELLTVFPDSPEEREVRVSKTDTLFP